MFQCMSMTNSVSQTSEAIYIYNKIAKSGNHKTHLVDDPCHNE